MIRYVSMLCLCTFALIQTPASAGKYFDVSYLARDAYQKSLSLRFDEARITLEQMKRAEPDNLMAIFFENYVDFLTIFIDDDEAAYNKKVKIMDARIVKMSRGDHSSPYYLYTQAEIRLQSAILRGRFGNYLTGLSDVKQAYALLEENQRRFPTFIANQKSLGVMHALIGNIPDDYKWAVKAVGGMKGSVDQGIRELEDVLNTAKTTDFVFEEETLVAYCFLQIYLNNQSEKAWNTLKNSKLSPKNNPLAAYAMANMALKTGRTDEALTILQQSPTGTVYHPLHYKNFLIGLGKLYRLDTDANKYLEAFVNNFKGKNAVKEAYQKLSWYHLVNGNEYGYRTNMDYVKSKGSDQSDPDKAALREAKSGEMPDPTLLKARLLFDGGYYKRAYDLLKDKSSQYSTQRKNKLEYTYRLGRIAHKMGRSTEGVQYYTQTIDNGTQEPWYFACNAALQMGILYEEKKDYKNAKLAYQKCLKINPEEYGSSLHTKAKAGLSRLK